MNQTMTIKELKELVVYDPETGNIEWVKSRNKKSTNTKSKSNRSINKGGYYVIYIKGKCYYAHRIAWLYMKGSFPDKHIDHINGVKTDNRWCNLRQVTNQQNHFNQKCKGYSLHKPSGKYQARIILSGENIYLGLFKTANQARRAYLEAKIKYHGKEYLTRAL